MSCGPKNVIISFLLIIFVVVIGGNVFAVDNIIYSLDFSKGGTSDPRAWLKSKGYDCEKDASSDKELGLSFTKNGALSLEAKDEIFGLIINKTLHLESARKIRITWGVNHFPEGASYENKKNNEAIMIYVYYGDKTLSSDSIFIPNAPYFIGLFLGESEPINKSYIGRHFSTGGRFICIGNPKVGETVISEFDLNKGFIDCFGKIEKKIPYISSIAIEVETSSTGPSKAFINKIEILK